MMNKKKLLIMVIYMAVYTLGYYAQLVRNEDKVDSCKKYEELSYISNVIDGLGVFSSFRDILAYQKVAYSNQFSNNIEFSANYILSEMCVFNSGEVTIRAQHLYSISGRDVHPLPKSGCTYLFYEVETVAPSALKGPIEHLVEYSVCETKNGCLLEAKTISLDFGKTRSMPIKNNCKFLLFMPHFSLDSSFA